MLMPWYALRGLVRHCSALLHTALLRFSGLDCAELDSTRLNFYFFLHFFALLYRNSAIVDPSLFRFALLNMTAIPCLSLPCPALLCPSLLYSKLLHCNALKSIVRTILNGIQSSSQTKVVKWHSIYFSCKSDGVIFERQLHQTIFISPGADITDYFNYGFTEDTWKQYCEKQRRLRMELSMPKKNFVRANYAYRNYVSKLRLL